VEFAVCLAVFGMVSFAVVAVFKLFSKSDLYQKRLELLKEPNVNTDPGGVNFQTLIKSFIQRISRLFAARSYTQNLQAQLIRAGIPLKGEEYITLCFAFIVLFPVMIYFLTHNLWLAVILVVIGFIIPQAYLKHKQNARLQAFNLQLGDALVIMANALRAGFGFHQTMETVRKEMPPPIAAEFAWTLREMNLGFSYEEALTNLSKRVGSEDLDIVVSGIIIQRKVGGNLAEVLDNISATIRERVRIKREIRVLTAQGRLSGLIIGILPLVLVFAMLVINPGYFNVMLREPAGVAVLAAGGVLEVLGIIIIRRLTDIDY